MLTNEQRRSEVMIQRYDWKCDCGHIQSVKADDGPWCSAKTVMQLETALLSALKEWEQIHGPWREACGADHWAVIAGQRRNRADSTVVTGVREMLTVKFFKYERSEVNVPNAITDICVREAEAIHVRYEAGKSAVVQCGDAPGETFEATVGEVNCAYHVAYIMNEAGHTIETVR